MYFYFVNLKDKKGSGEADAKDTKEEKESVITLRPLNMEDMRQAKNQVI